MSRSPIARWNHALWLGPLLAVFGFFSYFTIFYRWPSLRDVPWANFLILALAIVVSFIGLRRAWPHSGWRRIAGAASLLATAGIAGLMVWFIFVASADLPAADLSLPVGAKVPALALSDQRGQQVALAPADEKRVILVFYRGYW